MGYSLRSFTFKPSSVASNKIPSMELMKNDLIQLQELKIDPKFSH